MSGPVKLIVPITPESAFTVEEINFLREQDLTELWLFEYVLAMWGLIEDSRITNHEDMLYEQIAADIGEIIMSNRWDTATAATQMWFNQTFDRIYRLMRKLCDQLRPFLGKLPEGLPHQPVQVITYTPFTKQDSILEFHLEDPNPNWLQQQGMWQDRVREL